MPDAEMQTRRWDGRSRWDGEVGVEMETGRWVLVSALKCLVSWTLSASWITAPDTTVSSYCYILEVLSSVSMSKLETV